MVDGAMTVAPRPLRVVFVCTQNKLRSLTAETIFRELEGWEVTSAGTDKSAETVLGRDLLEWADVAVCMEKRHREHLRQNFKGALPDNRILVLGIPDDYEYMDAELVRLLQMLVPPRLASVQPRSDL